MPMITSQNDRPRFRAGAHVLCRQCSACRRDAQKQVQLDCLDAYRIAGYLRKHGRPGMEVRMVFDEFATWSLMPGSAYPIYKLNIKAKENECVFFQNGACSIYPVRPRACRCDAAPADLTECKCHFAARQRLDVPFPYMGSVSWIPNRPDKRFAEENLEFVRRERFIVPWLRRTLQGLQDEFLQAAYGGIVRLRDSTYDPVQSFLPQYSRNIIVLKNQLTIFAD